MEELSYSNLNNNEIINTGGGIFDILSGASAMTGALPIIYAVFGTCTLSMYLCYNSNKIFKKGTEEFFIYMWIGVLLIGIILAYLQVNDYLIAMPPFIGPGIYILLVVTLIMSCCFSM